MTSGSVERAYLGAIIQSINQDLATHFGVPVHAGTLISDVLPNTPAAAAGLKPGDIVTEFAGQKIHAPEELRQLVEMGKIGSSQPITILRKGTKQTLNITLQAQPKTDEKPNGEEESPEPSVSQSTPFDQLGLEAMPLTAETAQQLGIQAREGLVITNVESNSPAGQAGLTEGMVITEADGKPVKTPEDLQSILKGTSFPKGVLLLVRTSKGARFVIVHPTG